MSLFQLESFDASVENPYSSVRAASSFFAPLLRYKRPFRHRFSEPTSFYATKRPPLAIQTDGDSDQSGPASTYSMAPDSVSPSDSASRHPSDAINFLHSTPPRFFPGRYEAISDILAEDDIIPSPAPVELEDNQSEFEDDKAPLFNDGITAQGQSGDACCFVSGIPLKRFLYTRARYYIPSIGWLPNYDFKTLLLPDFIAGLTTALLLIPQALSLASLAQLPPVHGLYASFVPVVVYSLLGTSRQMAMGPEAVVSIMTGTTLANLYTNDDEKLQAAVILAFLVAIFTLALGIFRLGFIDSILSRALLRGFILAVACVIMIEQLPVLLGITSSDSPSLQPNDFGSPTTVDPAASPLTKLIHALSNLSYSNPYSIVISVASLFFLLLFQFLKGKYRRVGFLRFFPSILVIVFCTTLATWLLRLDLPPFKVQVLGYITGGYIPVVTPNLSSSSAVGELVVPAIIISVIGFVEAIVIGKLYANQYNYTVSANRELVALGVANLAGCFFGSYPTFASLPRSGVNNAAGARTQVAGFFTSLIILFTILFLLPLFQYLPRAVMASVVFVAAVGLVELEDVWFILRIRAWKDAILMITTFIVTIAVSIETGTLVSIALSLVLVTKHSTYPRFTLLGRLDGTDKFRAVRDHPTAKPVDGILVIRIDEPLYFANSGQLKDRLRRVERLGDPDVHPSEEGPQGPRPLRGVILDLGSMPWLDATAMQILTELAEGYVHRNVIVTVARLRDGAKDVFVKSGIIKTLGGSHLIFPKVALAMRYLAGEEGMSYSTYDI